MAKINQINVCNICYPSKYISLFSNCLHKLFGSRRLRLNSSCKYVLISHYHMHLELTHSALLSTVRIYEPNLRSLSEIMNCRGMEYFQCCINSFNLYQFTGKLNMLLFRTTCWMTRLIGEWMSVSTYVLMQICQTIPYHKVIRSYQHLGMVQG